MSIRFVYVYFMADAPARVGSVAPQHVEHWHRLNLEDYSGGPVADRSGGLITFVVDQRSKAEAAVAGDPFVRQSLLKRYWLKEWEPAKP